MVGCHWDSAFINIVEKTMLINCVGNQNNTIYMLR